MSIHTAAAQSFYTFPLDGASGIGYQIARRHSSGAVEFFLPFGWCSRNSGGILRDVAFFLVRRSDIGYHSRMTRRTDKQTQVHIRITLEDRARIILRLLPGETLTEGARRMLLRGVDLTEAPATPKPDEDTP